MVDNKIGAFLSVYGPQALTHQTHENTVTVQNSLIIGQSSNFDCIRDNVIPHHSTYYPSRRSPRPSGGKQSLIAFF